MNELKALKQTFGNACDFLQVINNSIVFYRTYFNAYDSV